MASVFAEQAKPGRARPGLLRFATAVLGVRAGRFWRDALRRRLLGLADVVTLFLAAGVLVAAGSRGDALAMLAWTPGWLVAAKLCGLYDRDHRALRHLTSDEVPYVIVYALAGTALMTVGSLALGVTPPEDSDMVRIWLIVGCGTLALRAAARYVWRRLTPPERAVVIGTGDVARATRKKIDLFADIHVEVVRQVSADAGDAADESLVRDADRIIVASDSVRENSLSALIEAARRHSVKLSVVPPMRGIFGTAVQLSRVAELPLVEYYTWDSSRTTLLAKRAVDLVVSAFALVVLLPVFIVVAVAIKLTSRGSVFFVQQRAGLGGRPFPMLKFRTMGADAGERLAEVVDIETLEAPAFKLRNDPRVTPLGRILRRTSLDELPQLANVLRGEMSLVGPRPEETEIVRRYRPEHAFRLGVKPGMTGPMQVYGRGRLSFEERLAVEREYVESFSFGRDLRILALTVTSVLWSRGAF